MLLPYCFVIKLTQYVKAGLFLEISGMIETKYYHESSLQSMFAECVNVGDLLFNYVTVIHMNVIVVVLYHPVYFIAM